MTTVLRFALPLVLAAACAGNTIGRPGVERLPTGTWGGEHVELTVTDSGATLEFDCAAGEIATPPSADDAGRVDVEGVFVRQSAGAVRIGEEPPRLRARYTGRLSGKTLTFDVTLVESKEKVGTYSVTHGEMARVRKCR